MPTPVSIGVDNGGTWIRLKGLDAKGRIVWSIKKPSPPVDKLPHFLKKHLQRFKGQLSYLAVGSKGVWKQAKRRAVKRALKGLAKNIVVMSDVEAAWLASFKSEGIIVISGTGSIAYGRTKAGAQARAGGLGPQKGDEGSGYWIGKEWLLKAGVENKKRILIQRNVRQVAQLAPTIILKAKMGNPTALGVIQEAQIELTHLALLVARQLRMKGIIPLSLHGSLLNNEWFRRGTLQQIRKRNARFKLISPMTDVAESLSALEI